MSVTSKELAQKIVYETEIGVPCHSRRGQANLPNMANEQKQLFPDCIIIIRVGEMYEVYGVDAVVVCEYHRVSMKKGAVACVQFHRLNLKIFFKYH